VHDLAGHNIDDDYCASAPIDRDLNLVRALERRKRHRLSSFYARDGSAVEQHLVPPEAISPTTSIARHPNLPRHAAGLPLADKSQAPPLTAIDYSDGAQAELA
jgi:hypothetical protein